jgi:hypothetical protein
MCQLVISTIIRIPIRAMRETSVKFFINRLGYFNLDVDPSPSVPAAECACYSATMQ